MRTKFLMSSTATTIDDSAHEARWHTERRAAPAVWITRRFPATLARRVCRGRSEGHLEAARWRGGRACAAGGPVPAFTDGLSGVSGRRGLDARQSGLPGAFRSGAAA